jgi:hypothetical protein
VDVIGTTDVTLDHRDMQTSHTVDVAVTSWDDKGVQLEARVNPGHPVTVYPEPGMFPAIGRALLAVADHPRDVVYVSSPRAGFIVSAEVFERFEKSSGLEQETPSVSGQVNPEPAKRRPGRPRKQTEPTESSEEQ